MAETTKGWQDKGWEAALAIEFDEWTPARVVAHVEIDERHHQPYGIVHGGVWASIVESVASHGAAHAAMDSSKVWPASSAPPTSRTSCGPTPRGASTRSRRRSSSDATSSCGRSRSVGRVMASSWRAGRCGSRTFTSCLPIGGDDGHQAVRVQPALRRHDARGVPRVLARRARPQDRGRPDASAPRAPLRAEPPSAGRLRARPARG